MSYDENRISDLIDGGLEEQKNKPENPEAFPVIDQNSSYWQRGMTLLDYFAAKAMVTSCDHGTGHEERTASCAYRLANAMLKEREKHLK